MKTKNLAFVTLTLLLILPSCQEFQKGKRAVEVNQETTVDEEKAAILARLNNETKDAFQRNYDAWTENWLHDPDITKPT